MKLNLKRLIAKTNAKNIIEAYENSGYEIKVDEEEWDDSESFISFSYKNKEGYILLFAIPKEEFEEKKPLEVGVWYNRREFDDNPNNYVLLEREHSGRYLAYNHDNHRLSESTTHFMYIEPVKDK